MTCSCGVAIGAGNVNTGLLSVPITLFTGGIGGFVWLMKDGTYWGMRSKVIPAVAPTAAPLLLLTPPLPL